MWMSGGTREEADKQVKVSAAMYRFRLTLEVAPWKYEQIAGRASQVYYTRYLIGARKLFLTVYVQGMYNTVPLVAPSASCTKNCPQLLILSSGLSPPARLNSPIYTHTNQPVLNTMITQLYYSSEMCCSMSAQFSKFRWL